MHGAQAGCCARDIFDSEMNTAAGLDNWVIEGCYVRSYPLRIQRADMIVLIDLPRWILVWRVLKRTFLTLGRTRLDMAEGCHERFDLEFLRYTWNWPKEQRSVTQDAISARQSGTKLVHLTSPRAVTRFLKSLSA